MNRIRHRLTLAAIRWLEHAWKRPEQMPHVDELPWIDAKTHPSIVIGPGVIYPPGLMIDFLGRHEAACPIKAFGTYGRREGVDWLLGFDAIDTSETDR